MRSWQIFLLLALSTTAADAFARAGLCAGTDAGLVPANAKLFDGQTYAATVNVSPYGSFAGGTRVACADVNADGKADLIMVPGAGAAGQVRIYNGRNSALLDQYAVFSASFTGGVYVAAGDVDGDNHADVIVGAGAGGGPQVIVFSGRDHSVLMNFFAFAPGFSGGVRVAAADVNGDGHADIIAAAGPGGTPNVRVFDGVTGNMIDDFLAFAATYHGGIFVAAADLTGDGLADLVVGADSGGASAVSVFNGVGHTPLTSFTAFTTYTGSVRVAAGDVNGDGSNDIVVATGSDAVDGEVSVLKWPTLGSLHDFYPFGAGTTPGTFVSVPPATDVIFADGFQP